MILIVNEISKFLLAHGEKFKGYRMGYNDWDNSLELDRLAELSIKTGVALQSGQDLLITAPLEAAPLVRRLAFHAYKQGCGIVTPLYTDPEVTLLRYQNANKDSFDKATD